MPAAHEALSGKPVWLSRSVLCLEVKEPALELDQVDLGFMVHHDIRCPQVARVPPA